MQTKQESRIQNSNFQRLNKVEVRTLSKVLAFTT